jgi:hypothetical protein
MLVTTVRTVETVSHLDRSGCLFARFCFVLPRFGGTLTSGADLHYRSTLQITSTPKATDAGVVCTTYYERLISANQKQVRARVVLANSLHTK